MCIRDRSGTGHALTGAYRDRQSILTRRIRTVIRRVVVAKRVECAIEIEIVDPRRCPLELEVAASWVSFGPVREITKRNEQVRHVLLTDLDEGRQRQQLSFESERQFADAVVRTAFAARCWDFDYVVGAIDRQ